MLNMHTSWGVISIDIDAACCGNGVGDDVRLTILWRSPTRCFCVGEDVSCVGEDVSYSLWNEAPATTFSNLGLNSYSTPNRSLLGQRIGVRELLQLQ